MTAAGLWTPGRLVLYVAIVATVYLATGLALTLVVAVALSSGSVPAISLGTWISQNAANGTMLSAASIATAMACIPLMKYLAGRVERSPWDFLGFRRVSAKTILIWVGVELALIVTFDSLAFAVDQPVVTDDMVLTLETSNLLFLLIGIAIAAPLVEEFFCRGFLVGALGSLKVPQAAIVWLTAVSFTILHPQYSGIALLSVLVGAVVWAVARLRTGSIVPCIAMHCTGNFVATVETMIVARLA